MKTNHIENVVTVKAMKPIENEISGIRFDYKEELKTVTNALNAISMLYNEAGALSKYEQQNIAIDIAQFFEEFIITGIENDERFYREFGQDMIENCSTLHLILYKIMHDEM
jgi:hypothetical protein